MVDPDETARITEAGRARRDLDALLAAENSAQAFRRLYELRKATNRKYSLAYFCREAEIPSTGYLSFVLSGKRVLAAKYKKGLVAAFGIRAEMARYLKLLIDYDNEGEGKRRQRLAKRLALARKVLQITYRAMPEDQSGLFRALEVYCAFSLFGNQPTVDQLVGYFGSDRREDVEEALSALVEMKLATRDGRRFNHLSNHVLFADGQSGLSNVDFLKLALGHAMENLEYWFPRREESYMTSSVLSVDFATYKRVLLDIRQAMLTKQAECETANANALIRFNVQIYPMRRPLD